MSTPNNLIEKTEVEGRKLSIVEALREALQEEMRRDERVILLGEDIGIKGGFGGAFTVTLGLSEEFGSPRVLDTPISEAGVTGNALGAALGGIPPVAGCEDGGLLVLGHGPLAYPAA